MGVWIMVAANIVEKTNRYQNMLSTALEDVSILLMEGSPLHSAALDLLEMARAYYDDGVHFARKEDFVNALVCFSYGYAWLDSGVMLGLFGVSLKEKFTV